MVFTAVIAAIAVGWIYESRSKATVAGSELEIPTDIDFFLRSMKYRVFDKSGQLSYLLQSPYLEHFIKDDISRIKQPVIHVYRAGGDWQINATQGDILHQTEWLRFDKNVIMQRLGGDPVQIRSDSMLFKPELDLVSSGENVVIESDSAKITGNAAVFDLGTEVYSLKNTKAIYYHADS
jgi:LPS export ABC transporter protein LptC